MNTILGHHHISMITKKAKENNYFYREILGFRRVKRTVNQDDPSMYHLFYGDKIGSPGTELTFFEIPLAGKTYRGTNAFSKIGLVVPSSESLNYWIERFDNFNIPHSGKTIYANREAIYFEDFDGLPLALQVAPNEKLAQFEQWEKSSVPVEHQLLGIGTVEIKVKRVKKITLTLIDLLGYTLKSNETNETIFQIGDNGIFSEILVTEDKNGKERPGRGSIHHLAIRVKNLDILEELDQKIKKHGFHSTGVIDRYYFHSLYFRESNGILFEIATDGPGFTRDSDLENLGEQLDLPDFLEPRREEIIKNLSPIEESSYGEI